MENTLNPVIVRFMRRFVWQWKNAKQNPHECFWRGGVRPCCRCWSITFGHKEPKAVCNDCQYEDNDQICRFCGTTRIDGWCPCDGDRYEEEYEEPDHSGPCRACGREVRGSGWACYGFCCRWCATDYSRDDRW